MLPVVYLVLTVPPPRVQENVTSYITALTDYAASFSVAQLALKVADAGLNVVEEVLKKTGTNEESNVVCGVRKIHSTANTIRISGLNKAGTEKAKKIEEASITEAVLFLLGVTDLLALLGFKLAKTEQVEEEEEVAEEKSDK